MTTFAAAPAATTTNAVKVGKGLAVHQGSGFENYPICGTTRALTTRYSAYKTGTEVEVTCLKCLREMEGNRVAAETAAAQAARTAEIEAEAAEEVHAALLLEDAAAQIAAEVEARRTEAPAEPIVFTEEMVAQAGADIDAHNARVAEQAARSAAVGEWLEGTIEAIRAATPADAIQKGDVVTLKADGLGWTVRRINKDGSLRLINEEGKKINRKPSAVTK